MRTFLTSKNSCRPGVAVKDFRKEKKNIKLNFVTSENFRRYRINGKKIIRSTPLKIVRKGTFSRAIRPRLPKVYHNPHFH